jgi:hypothetical protein
MVIGRPRIGGQTLASILIMDTMSVGLPQFFHGTGTPNSAAVGGRAENVRVGIGSGTNFGDGAVVVVESGAPLVGAAGVTVT